MYSSTSRSTRDCSETSRSTTHDDPTYVEEEALHYCVENMQGSYSRTTDQALNNVTLTQLGAEIDPGQDNENVRWTIYRSDPGKTFGTQVFSQIFNLGTDVGLTTYDSGLNLSLSVGFYILEM